MIDASCRAPRGALLWRNFALLAAAAVPMLLAFAAFATVFVGAAPDAPEPAWLRWLSPATLLSWAAIAILWTKNAWPHALRGVLLVDRRGVFVDGELAVPAALVRSAEVTRVAWTRPARAPIVRLALRGKLAPRYLDLGGELRAETVLAALGFDGARAPASFVLPGGLFLRMNPGIGPWMRFGACLAVAFVVAVLAGLSVSPSFHGELSPFGNVVAWLVGGALVAGYWVAWFATRLQIAIRPDGLWTRQAGSERLLAWREIVALEPWHARTRALGWTLGYAVNEGFDLVLRDGTHLQLMTYWERARRRSIDTDFIADRIEAACAAARAAATDDATYREAPLPDGFEPGD